jgi:hypothetical protein
LRDLHCDPLRIAWWQRYARRLHELDGTLHRVLVIRDQACKTRVHVIGFQCEGSYPTPSSPCVALYKPCELRVT